MTPRHGMPSFRQVLEGVDRAWREDRDGVEGTGSRLVGCARRGRPGSRRPMARRRRSCSTPRSCSSSGASMPATGGWGSAPKFPQPMTIEFLLGRAAATGDPRPLAVARRALDAMAAGGIHDQLGGGFHRYATDAHWLVPHFEQMLYDNAQLARAYLHAWAVTGDAGYRSVAERVLAYLLRELRDRGRCVRGQPGRRHGWRGGRDVHVDGRRDSDRPREPGPGATGDRRLRGDRGRQLGGQDDPLPGPVGRGDRGPVRAAGGRGPARAGGLSDAALRASADAPPAGSRRQGPRRLERPRDRGLRRRLAAAGGARRPVSRADADRFATCRGGRRGGRAQQPLRRRQAAALVEGRPGDR